VILPLKASWVREAFTVAIAVTAVSSPAKPITPSSHQSYENVIRLLPGQDDIRLLTVTDEKNKLQKYTKDYWHQFGSIRSFIWIHIAK
jgi:hypothetical protein